MSIKPFILAIFAAGTLAVGAQDSITYNIDPAQVQGKASVGVYGQFLEHIFNSVHGGLWGDIVRNGSLEPNDAGGGWTVKDGVIASNGVVTDDRVLLGSADWTDYDFTVEARKVGGAEGFLLMFRVTPDHRFYWANLGGWSNKEHGFEKNRGPFGEHVPGKIDLDRWYKIRIRCEGAHYQVWLDDQKVLDATDNNDPILKGAVALNAWGTQVEYRNVKVTSLDGQTVLFQGTPPANTLVKAPAYWEFFGDGQFNCDTNQPFNDRNSVRIRRSEFTGTGGLRQRSLALRAGDPVNGTLYIRGIAPTGVLVRFLDADGNSLFQKRLTLFGKDWTKQTFRYVPTRNVDDATLELSTDGLGDVGIDYVSIFPKSALDNGGFRADILAAIKALQPASIRYPGGCFASAYNWKDGVGPREKRTYYPNVIWADRDPNQMGTDEFIDLCRRVGAEPILAVNISRPVQETLDWMDYCNGSVTSPNHWAKERGRNGNFRPYKVKYWEIDNETWGMGVERYAEAVKKFSRAMRAKDPSVKIIACGGYGYDDGAGSSKDWNKGLIARAAKDFDYLSIHYYNGIMYKQDYVDDPRKYEAYIRDDIGALIRGSANTNLLVYCSEWGMMNDQWSSGLYTGGILNGFERDGSVLTMSCPAVWLQTVSATRPHPRWASCSILFDQKETYGAPTYVVEKLWREHFAPKVVKLDGPDRPLNSIASVTDDGRTLYLKLVNPEKEPRAVTVNLAPGWPLATAVMKVVDPGSTEIRNTLQEQPVKVTPGLIGIQGQTATFTMPALSTAAITFNRGKK